MKKLVVILFILGIILLVLLNNFDFFTSIIPGWHATIYPLWAIGLAILLVSTFLLIAIKILKLFFKKK
ncbi:membrane protein implicated in regulation of membrane protease activity [Flavobacterium arsenatis]|uniref:Membrane protein implicated in regulation of membrane protease activity n=1 Tax=Flavobacterium arsenatis TaxID=1484332 RepID=A0ABU1TRJ1_9FLAO|nr:membrane protein implicated in regulation of membrane protease activity [Flavobacterium arsenatis]